MEDPVSPETSLSGSLWEADSDGSVESCESDDIYEDLDKFTAPVVDEVNDTDDADIFQELDMIKGESLRCRASAETQEKPVFSHDRKTQECQNARTINEITLGKGAFTRTDGHLRHSVVRADKEERKKEDKTETLISNTTPVSSSNSKYEVPRDTENAKSNTKELQKEAEGNLKKISVESQIQGKSSSRVPLEPGSEGNNEENRTKDPGQGSQVTLIPGTSKNKDLEFILSRVMQKSRKTTENQEDRSCVEKETHVFSNQCSLARKECSLSLLKPDSEISSVRSAQCQHPSEEKRHLSNAVERSISEPGMADKKKKVQKREKTNKSSGRRVAAQTKESCEIHTPESVKNDSSSLAEKIMIMAKNSRRSTAADFMNVADIHQTDKISQQSPATKESKSSESQSSHLDLFEEFLVGQDRDELLQEMAKLKEERDRLQKELHGSLERCSGLEKDNEILLSNMSSLWKTSISQLRQRTSELATVKREKEAIIFRRAMRKVPRDELDRIASHIAAYDKEEFAEFINKLKEKEEVEKDCKCSRGTPNRKSVGSVAQRVREASRGTRLSPSSNTEAQALRNLLGKKGETVTHSEDDLRTWSKARGYTHTVRSPRCLFPRDDGRSEPQVSRSVWDRLGRNPQGQKAADTEDKEVGICTEEEEDASEKRVKEPSNVEGCGSSEKPWLVKGEKGKRRSVFSRLTIKRTNDRQEENATITSDVPADYSLGVTVLQEKKEEMNGCNKKTVNLADKCVNKEVSGEECQSESVNRSSRLEDCSISEPADAPCTTTRKQDKTGAQLSRGASPFVQHAQGNLGLGSGDEDEMLSKTLFGQRMKSKMKNLRKPRSVTKPQNTSPNQNVNKKIPKLLPEVTQPGRETTAQDKVEPLSSRLHDSIKKTEYAETKRGNIDTERYGEEETINQDLQDDKVSVEDGSRLRKKQLLTCREINEQNNDILKGDTEIAASKEDTNVASQEAGEIKRNGKKELSNRSEESRKIIEDSTGQTERTCLWRHVENADNEQREKINEKIITMGNREKQHLEGDIPEWEDFDSEEINTAILSLARLRSAFLTQERKIETRSTKSKKMKHLSSLFGEDYLSEDENQKSDKKAHKQNQETETNRKIPGSVTISDKQQIKEKINALSSKSQDVEVTEFLPLGENTEESENHSSPSYDSGKKQKQDEKGIIEDNVECVDTLTNSEYLKGQEMSRVAHQSNTTKEAVTKISSDRKRRSIKSSKKTSNLNTETKNESIEKDLMPPQSSKATTDIQDINDKCGKECTKGKKSKKRSIEKSNSGNMDSQRKERKAHSEEKDESNCCPREWKDSSVDKRLTCKSGEYEASAESMEDTVSQMQNTPNKTLIMNKKGSKKTAMDKTKVCNRNDRRKSDERTEASTSENREKDELHMPTISSDKDEAVGSSDDEDEEKGVVGSGSNPITEDLRVENISAGHITMSDPQQQMQLCAEEDKDSEGKEEGIEKSSVDSQRDASTEKNPDLTATVRVNENCQITCRGQKPVQDTKHTECEGDIRGIIKGAVNAAASVDDSCQDSSNAEDNDILKSILGTNYSEDSLFLPEEELLYDEGSEEEEEEEEGKEENSVSVSRKIKEGNYDNVENSSRGSRWQNEGSHQKQQTESQKCQEELDEGVNDMATHKAKETKSAKKTSSPPRSGGKREQDSIDTRSKVQRDAFLQGGSVDADTQAVTIKPSRSIPHAETGNTHTPEAIKRQSRGDSLTSQAGEKARRSRSPSKKSSLQKSSFSKHLGGRIKKLTVSSSRKGYRDDEKLASPLMVREERALGRRGKKSELKQPSRDKDGTPRSKGRRKETPEKSSRNKEEQSSHVLLSQNRKSPPRQRQVKQGSRKRERTSESETQGKRDRSPKTRGERGSLRRRESVGEKEEPATKRRRVSVKSRLSLPHNSDEENILRPARWQPLTLETERTRKTGLRLRNQSGEKRFLADVPTREPSLQDGSQYPSKNQETQKNTVPVDSKLLHSILTQSPSGLTVQEDEKEEGELDDEDEGGEEERILDKHVKDLGNNNRCDTDKTKMNRLSGKSVEQNSNRKDPEQKEVKRSTEKQNICVDNRDMQDAKVSESIKQTISISSYKDGINADQHDKICVTERENSPRSDHGMSTGVGEQQKCDQTIILLPKSKSSLKEPFLNQEIKNAKMDGEESLQSSSETREKEQKLKKRNCVLVDENATFFPGDLFRTVRSKAKNQLLPDMSVSLVSSVSDDTIDLMVRRHNENFSSDITNASDDSETSLLQYIADDDDGNCAGEEGSEKEIANVNNVSNLEIEEIDYTNDIGVNEGNVQVLDARKQARAQSEVTVQEKHCLTMHSADNSSVQVSGEITSMDAEKNPAQPYCRDTDKSLSADELESDDTSSCHTSPDNTPSVSKQISQMLIDSVISTARLPDNEEKDEDGDSAVCDASTYKVNSPEQHLEASSSEEEESDLDIENIDSEPEHTVNETKQTNHNAGNYNNISNDEQNSSERQPEYNTILATGEPDEDKPVAETGKVDDNCSSSDDSDSDSDCQCSDCSTSSSSSSSGSSSSSSSDSEMDDTVLDEAENVGRPQSACEENRALALVTQASDLAVSGPLIQATHSPDSPSKTPKKALRKTPSKSLGKKLSDSPNSITPSKKTPKKSPCKKTPCKKSPFRKALQDNTPNKKGKQDPVSPCATTRIEKQQIFSSPVESDHIHTLHECAEDNRIINPRASEVTQGDHDAQTLLKSQSLKHSKDRAEAQDKSITTPQSDSSPSRSKSHSSEDTPLSHSFIRKTYQLRRKISPIDSSSSRSKTYHLQNVSLTSVMKASPSMPFIETVVVPFKGRSAGFGWTPGQATQLSCTDSTNVISVVHSGENDESSAPVGKGSKASSQLITVPSKEKPRVAQKRHQSPNAVVTDMRTPSGKKIRLLSPSMLEEVSPRKLFSTVTEVKQKTVSATQSNPESSSGSSKINVKGSISKDIVVPVTLRRPRRLLEPNLSGSLVQHVSFGRHTSKHTRSAQGETLASGASQQTEQREGSSTVQVFRRSPRKPKRPSRLDC